MPANLTLTTAEGHLMAAVTLPTGWADVTLTQYLALVAPDSPAPDAVLTGLAPNLLDALADEDRGQLLERLLFLTETDVLRELVPTPGLYEIGCCAYGLYGQAEQYFAAHPELVRLAQGAYLYALYRAPTATTAPAEELAAAHAAVLAAPLTAVYADCQHFLASWERHHAGTSFDGPAQPGLLRITPDPTALVASAAPGWLARLGRRWAPSKRAA